MPKVTLYEGDNRVSLKLLADNSIPTVVTDTPYGLTSMADRFGAKDSKPARKEKNDGSFARLGAGFMQKTWDGSGIERDPDFWREVLRVLKPGGYLIAFSGSRTYHRMATAIEDAGFIIHPMIGWLNGQGFPKAHAADKAIDKLLGKQGEIVPATAEAAEWQGWAYGGQVRKPALEPICVAQKPFSEKSGAANILKWGVGAVNVDGCRVPTDEVITNHSGGAESAKSKGKYGDSKAQETHQTAGQSLGRHPANLIHDGSPEVVALFPDSKGQQAASKGDGEGRKTANCYGVMGHNAPVMQPRGDTGSAARFFECYPFEDRPAFYHPKAGKEDRAGSKHPTVKPIALMQALVRHVTPPGGVVLDPFAGSGTTAEAARREGFDCILMEAEPEYIDFLNERFGLRSQTSLTDLLA